MESSSYEIEMFFGHLVIGNLQLVIGNRLLAEGKRKKTICNWTDQSVCFVSGQSGVSRQTRMSGQTRISKQKQIRLSNQN